MQWTASLVSLSLCYWGLGTANTSILEQERVKFAVRDAIELEQVIRQSGSLHSTTQANPVSGTSLRSPDGAHFLIQTRKGIVDQNVLQDTLWIVDADAVTAFLDSKGSSRVMPAAVYSRQARHEKGVLSNVQWLNASDLGFLAGDGAGVRQAFAIDIHQRNVRQLTFSPSDVTAFAARGSTLLYYAVEVEDLPETYSITSSTADLGGIIDPETYSDLFPRVDLFAKVGRAPAKRIESSPMRLLPYFQSIWISPDERYAVAMQPAIAWPAYWEEYHLPTSIPAYSRADSTSDGTSSALVNRTQYRLVDIRSSTSSVLLDAPMGLLSLNFTPARAFWMRDSTSVVISGTFLPLTGSGGAARRRRAERPAIAEIEVESRQVTPIVWEPIAISDPSGGRETVENPIVELDFAADELIVYTAKQHGSILASTDPSGVSARRYAKSGDRWKSLPKATQSNVTVDVRQSLNERAKIYASGAGCKCSRLLWDPNPYADRFSFGRASVIEWDDANGIAWHGGLILPPNYDERGRYPLVIQTHGFHADEFLIDGPQGATTAFAAQPLANAGFIVLQLEENARAETGDVREAARYAEGMRSAIVKLDQEGHIDASRVAAIGWSISGTYVLRLLSEHPDILAAAVVSDAAQFGYVPYLLGVNLPASTREAFEKLAGVDNAATNPAALIARDPLQNLALRTPPIRLEAIRASSVLGMWETYALLRLSNSAVDFVYFPDGSHSLQKPAERMGSQQGTVDWLRFWLQDEEDQSSEKRSQYELWRSMRQHALAKSR